MNLELVSFPLCPFVHRVGTLLREEGADFSIRYIDLKDKPDWFLAISPKGRVPVLLVDGRPLFESAALLEFVDETQGAPRLPRDPFERARQRAFIAFAGDVFVAQYQQQTAGSDGELVTAIERLRAQLAVFEAAIGEGPWFAKGDFGLVDAAIAPALQRLVWLAERAHVDSFGDLGRVRAYAARVASRASVQAALPPDFDRLFAEALRSGPCAIGRRLVG